MDANANTNITFEQMPQALAEVLSQVRLIKEAVLNGDNSKRAGRGSHVLIDIDRACEITGKSKHTLYRYVSLYYPESETFTEHLSEGIRIFRNYSGTPDLTINIRKREAFATLI